MRRGAFRWVRRQRIAIEVAEGGAGGALAPPLEPLRWRRLPCLALNEVLPLEPFSSLGAEAGGREGRGRKGGERGGTRC